MDKILNVINDYALRVYKHTYYHVSHMGGNNYLCGHGGVSIYYTVVGNRVIDSMVD